MHISWKCVIGLIESFILGLICIYLEMNMELSGYDICPKIKLFMNWNNIYVYKIYSLIWYLMKPCFIGNYFVTIYQNCKDNF